MSYPNKILKVGSEIYQIGEELPLPLPSFSNSFNLYFFVLNEGLEEL